MDGVGAGRPCGGDQLCSVEVAPGALQPHSGVRLGDVWGRRVGIGVDGDGSDTQTPAGGEHPPGDLATVGDKDARDHAAPSPRLRFLMELGRFSSETVVSRAVVGSHAGPHIRKTPKFDVPSIGPLAMADRHIPNTVRVSRGSITPSS